MRSSETEESPVLCSMAAKASFRNFVAASPSFVSIDCTTPIAHVHLAFSIDGLLFSISPTRNVADEDSGSNMSMKR